MSEDFEYNQYGIAAIIHLQDMVGIRETVDEAVAGWAQLSISEKAHTMEIFELFCGPALLKELEDGDLQLAVRTDRLVVIPRSRSVPSA